MLWVSGMQKISWRFLEFVSDFHVSGHLLLGLQHLLSAARSQ